MKKKIMIGGIILLFISISVIPSVTSLDISKNKYNDIGDNSELSDVFPESTTVSFKNRFLYMVICIKNNGNEDIHNIPWTLKIRDNNDAYSFKYPTEPINGNIKTLKAHRTYRIRTKIIAQDYDFYKYWALIEYWIDGVWNWGRADGYVYGPFILLVVPEF